MAEPISRWVHHVRCRTQCSLADAVRRLPTLNENLTELVMWSRWACRQLLRSAQAIQRYVWIIAYLAIFAVVAGAALWRKSDRGLQALVAFGTISAAFAAVFHDWLRAVLVPPKLRFRLRRPTRADEHRDVELKFTGTTQRQVVGQGWYLGLDVVNERPRRPAHSARIELAAMFDVGPGGNLRDRGMSVECPLFWALLPEPPIVLTVWDSAIANFIRLTRLHDGGHLVCTPYLRGWTTDFCPGIAKGETVWCVVQVRAEYLPRAARTVFEVHWDGQWPAGDDPAKASERVRIRPVPPGEAEEKLPRRFRGTLAPVHRASRD